MPGTLYRPQCIRTPNLRSCHPVGLLMESVVLGENRGGREEACCQEKESFHRDRPFHKYRQIPGKYLNFVPQTMMNVKKTMLLAAVAALLLSVCLVSGARGTRSAGSAPADTLVVNTTELCKDVIGYDGPTPLLIKVVKGVVVKVEALPNTESPSYFDRRHLQLGGRDREPPRGAGRSRPEVVSSFPEKFYLCGD